MSLQFDQLNNQLKTNDSTNANASMVLTPAGTGSVLLNGTGQNLVTQSQTFSGWANNAVTTTTNVGVAPDGTSTAAKLTEAASTNYHYVSITITVASGSTSTASCYFKAAERTFANIQLGGIGFSNFGISVNLTNGTYLSYGSFTSASVVGVGNGWYRCSITGVSTNPSGAPLIMVSNASSSAPNYAGDGTSGIYIWGAQVENGPTANTYVPTTTATIYNAPVLSLSGVANIGLQSDGALYVQPAGTGAIQAQATTSTATGGNARGVYAVDWSTIRGNATQVASGYASVVCGGLSATNPSFAGVIVGGNNNQQYGAYSFIGAGVSNTVNGYFSFIGAGQNNTANGYYNFVGGGQLNSGTSNSAVTTQSATMNGTTAVTLSGSNASIKVGQYITGTSIGSDTYVAAVSGTSLTLSKVATGSTTNTLTFFTPHGVVVGGGNNTATGSYSFIGGGGDAGTSSNGNVASGDWSTVGGGIKNVASGIASVVAGGGTDGNISGNTASGVASFIGGGRSNVASNYFASVVAGVANTASGVGSSIYGGNYGTTRGIAGNTVTAASDTPLGTYQTGQSQTSILVLARQTTDATATALASTSSAASSNNQVIMPNNSAYYFRGEVVSGVTGCGNTKGWYIEGVIKRGANAASTALVGTPTVMSSYADVGAATWTIAVTADTTNGGLAVTFTGQASTTIRTVAQIRTTEMTY